MTDTLAAAPTRMVGQPIKRREDPRLITGAGSFLDDVRLPGMTHAVLVRSPYAHARIKRIDTSPAKGMPGVVGVFTGDDFMDVNPLPPRRTMPAGRRSCQRTHRPRPCDSAPSRAA